MRAAVGLDELVGWCPLAAAVGGQDIAAEGGDWNVFVARRGPVVLPPVAWRLGNTTQTAHRAADEAERARVTTLHYDCVGVGAGVRGTLESSERVLRFTPNAVNGGSAPTETCWPDGKSSKQRFLNLRAELWWLLRTRFEQSYELRLWLEGQAGGVEHPFETCISLPPLDQPGVRQLAAELSLPLHAATESGKIKLESKAEMRKRGVKSPDYADALAYTLTPLLTWTQDRALLEWLARR